MDPNLFHLDYETVAEVLIGIVLLSFLIERALALLFESRWFISKTEDGKVLIEIYGLSMDDPEAQKLLKQKKKKGLKESISFIVSFAICWILHFDALTIIFTSSAKTNILGYAITGAIIAGGSKAAIKLFKDWMGFKSSAEKERESAKENLRNNPNS